MANNDTQVASASEQGQSDTQIEGNTAGKSDYVSSIPAGTLIGTDWSKEPPLILRESQINAIRSLLKKLMMRDTPAYREELIKVWEAELFWRGYQHLLPSRVGFGWEFAGPGSGFAPGDVGNRSTFEMNYYHAYGKSVVSALTRKIPTVRFVPICPQSDVDITAADQANKLVGVICRNNKMQGLMAEMARFLYTDGRASFYTRYVKDGQRFGYKEEETQDEEDLVPETEEKAEAIPGSEDIAEAREESEETPESPKSFPEPCGREVITVHGALEVKYPIRANYQSEMGWLIWSVERDLSVAKGMYPKKADKIVVSRGGPAGDDIGRMARINTSLGVQDNFITSDSQVNDVTIQNAWLRPCTLQEIDDEQIKQEMIEMADGIGLRLTFCGEAFVEAKKESMDDHWTLIQADAGDGIHRSSLGADYLPAQKIVNTLWELANDYLINGIPCKWMDNETFDVEHVKDQTNTPGAIRPFVAPPGIDANQLVVMEPTIQYPTGLSDMIDALGKGQDAQILTGIFPALSGDDTGNNDTGIGIKLQRDAALGRLGIPWRNIKEGVASIMLQAVQCLARNHDEDIVTSGLKEGSDMIMVELQDLKGHYYCEPDTDENFPESFTEIQGRVEDMVSSAQANPAILEIVNAPENYDFVKRSTGLTELVIPKGLSYEKQLGELEELKKSGPLPNPEIAQVNQQIAQLTQAAQSGDTNAIAQLQNAQNQITQLPPTVTSVPIDEEIDDHATEAETCLNFLRGPIGRAMKNGMDQQQQAYANIKMHFQAHAAAAQKVAQASKNIPEKGVTKSISADALVKAGVPLEQAVEVIKSL